ncbi:ribosomal 50S subunit-recycling heat shock protein [Ruminococcaceae bacterium R-25]|jgi:ribosomal 50S subunit-recycling heat shock protein|nr:ribosomal 50S subunit-recycling heat shock protein [Ruminococcaceae bacterium R-25]SUQ22461.1 Ribosomal 50S subunit-recycling heat shock protein, contains S4 domain [Oscillospiraceae bacterium]
MRLDKFLKLSRVIKRRTVANDVCQAGRVTVNGKPAKPSVKLKVGDVVTILFGSGEVKFKVLSLQETVRKEEAASMYELLE